MVIVHVSLAKDFHIDPHQVFNFNCVLIMVAKKLHRCFSCRILIKIGVPHLPLFFILATQASKVRDISKNDDTYRFE